MQPAPNFTGYVIEEVEIPAPHTDEARIDREVLGIDPPTPPPGPPTRMLQITLKGDTYLGGERPFEVRIGGQTLDSLALTDGGTSVTGLLQRMPGQGEEIAFHLAPIGDVAEEPQVLVAEAFDPSKLDDRTA